MPRVIKFNQAILEATDQMMEHNPSVYVMGLGAPDPKGLFGTTLGLGEKYGPKRVMDIPISENALTGVAVGSALMGMRPIMTHQRVDFILLALDQLINNAAKWHYMFGGQDSIPMVVRLLIGRGWGQGPQHSQTLHSLFAHIPGLKVVMPSSPYDAKGLLVSAIEDNNPVIFLEHRWLHESEGDVPKEIYRVPLGKANVIRQGEEITLITSCHMVVEARQAVEFLKRESISVELIDLRSIRPFDRETIAKSVKKTGRVLVVDPDWKTGGFASEIITSIVETSYGDLKVAPQRLTYPDYPCPTSWQLANHYYPTWKHIAAKALEIMGKSSKQLLSELEEELKASPLDRPDASFTGPF